jgi:hypothetical protein
MYASDVEKLYCARHDFVHNRKNKYHHGATEYTEIRCFGGTKFPLRGLGATAYLARKDTEKTRRSAGAPPLRVLCVSVFQKCRISGRNCRRDYAQNHKLFSAKFGSKNVPNREITDIFAAIKTELNG